MLSADWWFLHNKPAPFPLQRFQVIIFYFWVDGWSFSVTWPFMSVMTIYWASGGTNMWQMVWSDKGWITQRLLLNKPICNLLYYFASVLFFAVFCHVLAYLRIWKNTDHFWPNCKGSLLPLLIECNHSRTRRETELRVLLWFFSYFIPYCWNSLATSVQTLPLETHLNPRCFKSSLNPHLSSPVYCDCPVTFLHKGQRPHTEQMREQEAELMLRSL